MKVEEVVEIIFGLIENLKELEKLRSSIERWDDFKEVFLIFYKNHFSNYSSAEEISKLTKFLLWEKNETLGEEKIKFGELTSLLSPLFSEEKKKSVAAKIMVFVAEVVMKKFGF